MLCDVCYVMYDDDVIMNEHSNMVSTYLTSSVNNQVVFPDVIHPSLGSSYTILQFISVAHSLNIHVICDIDFTGFSSASNYYNYDLSSSPTPFGPLFQSTSSYSYNDHTCRAADMGEDHPMNVILSNMLYRYSYVLGFDGVYWKGLLCFRLDDARCGEGKGEDNAVNTELLKEIKHRFDTVKYWVGTWIRI